MNQRAAPSSICGKTTNCGWGLITGVLEREEASGKMDRWNRRPTERVRQAISATKNTLLMSGGQKKLRSRSSVYSAFADVSFLWFLLARSPFSLKNFPFSARRRLGIQVHGPVWVFWLERQTTSSAGALALVYI